MEATHMVKAQILSVRAEVVPDSDGDYSWLEQTPAQLGSLETAVGSLGTAVWNRRRLNALRNGDWWFVGVRVVVDVAMVNLRGGTENTFTLDSAGLWGIESDSGAEYFAQVAADEWGELAPQLLALGFTDEDLSEALDALDWDSRLVWK